MAVFTASNGVVIGRDGDGRLRATSVEGLSDYLWADHEVAFREYFAQEPKAWESAKAGEVWALTMGRDVQAFVFSENRWWPLYRNATALDPLEILTVTAGRRIWPEGDQS